MKETPPVSQGSYERQQWYKEQGKPMTATRRMFLGILPGIGMGIIGTGYGAMTSKMETDDRFKRVEDSQKTTEQNVANLGNLAHAVNQLQGEVVVLKTQMGIVIKGESIIFERLPKK